MSQNINKLTKPKRKLDETNVLEDNTDVNEPENKRIKLSEEKATEITNNDVTSTKPDFTSDLSTFSDLPNEILYHHVAVLIPIEWLYVSKYLHNIAVQNLERDPRIKWDKQSFEGALKVDNVTAIIKHLSMTKFDDAFILIQLMAAARSGCIRVLQHLLENDSILKLHPSDTRYIYTYSRALINAISNGHKDVVMLLINSGRYVGGRKATNIYLQAALSKNQKSIAMILIENGFFSTDNIMELVVRFITPGCDIELLQILLSVEGVTNMNKHQRMKILDRTTKMSANDVELVVGFFEFITAVAKEDMATVNEFLLDEGFEVTKLTSVLCVEKAVHVNSRKILKRLLDDERVRKSIDFRHLMLLVAKSGTEKIFKALLDDENIDLASCVDTTLITTAFLNPEPYNIILTLLDCPRIDYNFYASFALCTAIQFKSKYVTETILNDPRFVVMDDTHHQVAIDFATIYSQDDLISQLMKIKVTKLGPN